MRKKLGPPRLSVLESISRWKAKVFFELFVLLSSTVLLVVLFNSAYSSSYYLNLFDMSSFIMPLKLIENSGCFHCRCSHCPSDLLPHLACFSSCSRIPTNEISEAGKVLISLDILVLSNIVKSQGGLPCDYRVRGDEAYGEGHLSWKLRKTSEKIIWTNMNQKINVWITGKDGETRCFTTEL